MSSNNNEQFVYTELNSVASQAVMLGSLALLLLYSGTGLFLVHKYRNSIFIVKRRRVLLITEASAWTAYAALVLAGLASTFSPCLFVSLLPLPFPIIASACLLLRIMLLYLDHRYAQESAALTPAIRKRSSGVFSSSQLKGRIWFSSKRKLFATIFCFAIPPLISQLVHISWHLDLIDSPRIRTDCRNMLVLPQRITTCIVSSSLFVLCSFAVFRLSDYTDNLGILTEIKLKCAALGMFSALLLPDIFTNFYLSDWFVAHLHVHSYIFLWCLTPVISMVYTSSFMLIKGHQEMVHRQTKLLSEGPRCQLLSLLETEQGVAEFFKFLKGEFNLENLFFWEDVNLYKYGKMDSVSIFQNYIPNNAPLCINISSQTRKDLIEKFKTIPGVSFESSGVMANMKKHLTLKKKKKISASKPTEMSENTASSLPFLGNVDMSISGEARDVYELPEILKTDDLFDRALEEVLSLMANDSFSRFKETDSYKLLMASHNVLQRRIDLGKDRFEESMKGLNISVDSPIKRISKNISQKKGSVSKSPKGMLLGSGADIEVRQSIKRQLLDVQVMSTNDNL